MRGITLFPDEAKHFPEWAVFPCFRYGDEVITYQLGEHVCPMLYQGKCTIYGNHPLICKAFPVCHEPQKGLTVAFQRCARIWGNKEEDFDYESFGKCFDAAREREKRESALPQPTAVFDLNKKAWVNL